MLLFLIKIENNDKSKNKLDKKPERKCFSKVTLKNKVKIKQ